MMKLLGLKNVCSLVIIFLRKPLLKFLPSLGDNIIDPSTYYIYKTKNKDKFNHDHDLYT